MRRTRASAPDCDQEESFWEHVGATFPSLKGAASTEYYRECERILHEKFFPPLLGRLLFKTDLWDEAKNTEILVWAAGQGARPAGVDISLSTAKEAYKALAGHRPLIVVADLRALPFRSCAFDLVYSMGTIEHFLDYEIAVREIFRVLKPGGRAIVGVPNKLDPFLRPMLVWLLQRMGKYAYGREKAFTAGALGRLMESEGFRIVATSGILFIPGWLRMVDLWFHARVPAMERVSGAAVRPFAWAYRRFEGIRRHGYLLACIVEK